MGERKKKHSVLKFYLNTEFNTLEGGIGYTTHRWDKKRGGRYCYTK